jgi:hypothetical protein
VIEPEQHNASAVRVHKAGFEQALTLQRTEVLNKLSVGSKTTNPIESVMTRVGAKTSRITRYRRSNWKRRGCAAMLLEIETDPQK